MSKFKELLAKIDEHYDKIAAESAKMYYQSNMKFWQSIPKICKFCNQAKPELCEHGFCRVCQCKEYCWID